MKNKEAADFLGRELPKVELDGQPEWFMNEFLEASNLAIQALEKEECEDAISRREALRIARITTASVDDVVYQIEHLPSVQPVRKSERIPVKYHIITDEEREKEGYPDDWLFCMDCRMPENGEEILITTQNGWVEKDECCYEEDGYFLDSGYDWLTDVAAWMPLPEAYKQE